MEFQSAIGQLSENPNLRSQSNAVGHQKHFSWNSGKQRVGDRLRLLIVSDLRSRSAEQQGPKNRMVKQNAGTGEKDGQ